MANLPPARNPQTAGAKPAPAAKPAVPAKAAPAPAAARPANRPAPAGHPVPAKPAPAQVAGAAPAGTATDEGEEAEEFQGGGGGFLLFMAMPSWLISMIFHIMLLVILAFITIAPPMEDMLQEFTMGPDNDEVEEIEEFEDIEIQELDVQTDVEVPADLVPVETQVDVTDVEVSEANDMEAAAVSVEIDPLGSETAPKSDMLASVGAFTGSALEGRGSAAARKAMAQAAGGSAGSEAAVALALKWIASRQAADGGWNFNHNISMNPRPCPDPGTATAARNGATGLALLPFLGSGQTHKEGAYKAQVHAGLKFMINNMKVNAGARTGSFHEKEGSMYSHGIASIVMCEAYAMTHDKDLLAPAQLAINYIVYAQDPVGGGWRYNPKQAGDTSAVGWQLMALKSGHMAYLQVPKGTVLGASKFLDSVQAESGAKYGYTNPGSGAATTSVGLLSRMYLGWKHDNPSLQRGVEYLDRVGPSKNNMYFNYYATQIMRHNEGEPWKRWNARMRDWLVGLQSKDGVTAGSWYFKGGDHGTHRGGRLYCTSMATMILEVYYRHMPIYRKQAAEEDFKL